MIMVNKVQSVCFEFALKHCDAGRGVDAVWWQGGFCVARAFSFLLDCWAKCRLGES